MAACCRPTRNERPANPNKDADSLGAHIFGSSAGARVFVPALRIELEKHGVQIDEQD
jgi:hypothetical protein